MEIERSTSSGGRGSQRKKEMGARLQGGEIERGRGGLQERNCKTDQHITEGRQQKRNTSDAAINSRRKGISGAPPGAVPVM